MKIHAGWMWVVGTVCAIGAEPSAAPSFQNSRFDDDAAARQAALYYSPIGDAGTGYVAAGGQIRLRAESWKGFAFSDDNESDYLLSRLRAHVDVRACPGFRVYVEGISADAGDRDLPGGRRPADVDSADLLNAFADLSTTAGGADWTLRGGRQELSFGKQRLVSPLDWSNTRRTFDGARLTARSGDLRVDGFATRWVQVQKYEFNDGDSGRDFYGIYATRAFPDLRASADVYWLGLDRDTAKMAGVEGRERRDTFGTRLNGTCGKSGFDYDVEAGIQSGEIGDADVEAFFAAGQWGYRIPDCPVKSRAYVGYDYASGDNRPGDSTVKTFNQLFPLGHAHFGAADHVGRQNISAFSAGMTAEPFARTQTRLEAHWFERADTRDALYDAGGSVLRAGDAGRSREIGQEVDFTVDYRWNPRLLLQLGFSYLFAGDFIKESGDSDDVRFAYLTAQVTL